MFKMAVTLNVNAPNTTINVNSSSEDSGNQIPKYENTKYRVLSSLNITDDELKIVKCDHRNENNVFDVDLLDMPSVYRCNKCNEIIDLSKKYDDKFIENLCNHLWKTFQAMKANNDGYYTKEHMDDLGACLFMLRKYMPDMVKTINDRASAKINNYKQTRSQYQHPYAAPFASIQWDYPKVDMDKPQTPPSSKKDENKPPKPQTPPSSK